MPAATSLRYNVLPSNLPTFPPNLDGEAAFVINGISQGMILQGVPFTTTEFSDFETLGVLFADTMENAVKPEFGNNNLLLQAKAFYDLAGPGARVHWLVVSNQQYSSVTLGADQDGTPLDATVENNFRKERAYSLVNIFDNNDDSLFRRLVMHAERSIRLLCVSLAVINTREVFALDNADPAVGMPLATDNDTVIPARIDQEVTPGTPADGLLPNRFVGDLGEDEIRAIDNEAGYWEVQGMPFLTLIGADYEGSTAHSTNTKPTIDFTNADYRRTAVVVGGHYVRVLQDEGLSTGDAYDNLTRTELTPYRTKAPVGLCLGSLYTRSVQESLVKVANGNVPNLDQSNAFIRSEPILTLSDSFAELLNNQRYIYLRTYPGLTGAYWATDSLANSLTSSHARTLQERRVVGKAIFLTSVYLQSLLGSDLFLTAAGRLAPEEVDLISSALNSTLETSLINTGNATGAVARILNDVDFRVEPMITISLSVSPKGVAKDIVVNVGAYING